ncbi:MAG: DUF1109 family protein [Alphaproteobacteria bacterium]|nr:DUF1109 family protein [Alphaproteobacteria bacterium]
MKTEDLIALIGRDAAPVPRASLPARLGVFGLVVLVLALIVLLVWLGVRPDLASALHTSAYWMKTIYTTGLAIAGFALVERLSRPGASARLGAVLLGACIAVIAAIAVIQLYSAPATDMTKELLGSTWDRCPWRILALSLPGLVAVLLAMRRFAPTRPALAGAAAGLFVGGLSATVYGLYCQETAAPFVAIWYSLGVGLSGLLGAATGHRALRW